MSRTPLLSVRDLRKEYDIRSFGRKRSVKALDGVSFDVRPNEILSIVGESGSGKSTVARCITRLTEPTSGAVHLSGTSVLDLSPRDLPKVYRDLQMVFQDPNSSLDPRQTVYDLLDEPLRLHRRLDRAGRQRRASELLEAVALPVSLAERLPHQLSGGQRQRIGIARALAVDPKVIILDEPTASLDVSIRGQIIRLLKRLQVEQGISYVLISHDLAVVEKISDRVLVMYLGRTVEEGTAAEVFGNPVHPYTQALLSAAPKVEFGQGRSRLKLEGEIPSPIDLPSGCRLAGRCPLARPECRQADPPLLSVSETHRAACPVTVAGRRTA